MDTKKAKRVLLLHISGISGHRSATLAIEKALHEIDGAVQTKSIDAFAYTSPFFERMINSLYMGVIRVTPKFWDYLYDNEDVLKKLQGTRALIHKAKDKKIKRLLEGFGPDIVVCTQAFPCGMVADYKRRHNLGTPLMAVLTDYAPHSYWLNESVDASVVPSARIQQRFIQKGVPEKRLNVLGIPVDTKFRNLSNREQTFRQLGLDSRLPAILIMGGGQGLGPIKEIVRTLDALRRPVQLIVICGTNKRLYRWLHKNKRQFVTPLAIIGYTEQVHNLMAISSFIVTKPGGITSAEALSKSLPMIIVRPLPGQESHNTQFLLKMGAAFKAENFQELKSQAEELLDNTTKLNQLREKAACLAHPDSGLKIARLILNLMERPSN